MDDIDNTADGILAQLPDWSKTSDPEARLDYTGLRAASVTFLHRAAEMRQYYRVSAQALKDLQAVGLPSDVMTALGAIDSGKIFKGEQLLSLLSQKLGRKLEPGNDLLILKYSEIWRSKVRQYSATYCFPKFNQSKAAALYLFLRLIFELPADYPMDKARVFGGWMHPSTNAEGDTFNQSWPVEIRNDGRTAVVHPFRGYFGKGYDGIGEYDYFMEHFPLRRPEAVEKLDLQSS